MAPDSTELVRLRDRRLLWAQFCAVVVGSVLTAFGIALAWWDFGLGRHLSGSALTGPLTVGPCLIGAGLFELVKRVLRGPQPLGKHESVEAGDSDA